MGQHYNNTKFYGGMRKSDSVSAVNGSHNSRSMKVVTAGTLGTVSPVKQAWEDLANAIVIQAAKDWINTKTYLLNSRDSITLRDAKLKREELVDIEDFFLSDRIKAFTEVRGDLILRLLKLEWERDRCKSLNYRVKKNGFLDSGNWFIDKTSNGHNRINEVAFGV